MGQKPVLGKGLASLLPGAATPVFTAPAMAQTILQPEVPSRDRHPGISIASLEEITVNHYQPRKEFDDEAINGLAQSIRENGIIQPLIVRKGVNGYQLIAGERRLRAAKIAGLKQVPIVIKKSSDKEALELALIENIQREDLNCVEVALAYQQLMFEFSLTQDEVAIKVGKERTSVTNHLRLLKLPTSIIENLKNGVLSFGHAKVILSLEDDEQKIKLSKRIIENKLSVRATEVLIDALRRGASGENSDLAGGHTGDNYATQVQSRFSTLADDLTRQWASRVEIKGTEHRGKILLHYGSRQELDRILSAMQNEKVWVAQ